MKEKPGEKVEKKKKKEAEMEMGVAAALISRTCRAALFQLSRLSFNYFLVLSLKKEKERKKNCA